RALGGEIKEEVAAAGRRRGTFAGKGTGPQRPTRRRLRLESVKAHFFTWKASSTFLLAPLMGEEPKKKPGHATGL
ncbi:MAG: hypothetical protein ACN6RH_10060, partial [Stenotrophomonas rhizophila]|uniref:hypothetical protein n=1 Tax=Stenotrophomonas rhizophila TaxID=216778 RepID=UPI003D13A8F3